MGSTRGGGGLASLGSIKESYQPVTWKHFKPGIQFKNRTRIKGEMDVRVKVLVLNVVCATACVVLDSWLRPPAVLTDLTVTERRDDRDSDNWTENIKDFSSDESRESAADECLFWFIASKFR